MPYNPAGGFVFRIICFLAVLRLCGQQIDIQPCVRPDAKTPKKEISPRLRVDSSLVLVPLTVTDKLGRPVLGMEKENFRVLDNGVEQTIVQIAMEDEPVAVGFVFDISGSIGINMGKYRVAAHEFFRVADENDEFFLVEFESRAKLAVPLTKNAGAIDYQIMMTRSKGTTALFDGVYMAANEIRKSKLNKKAIILISDGGENNSRYRQSELESALRETDALLYSIGPSPSASYGDNNGALMKHLAEITGGRLIQFDGSDLADLAQKIIIDLRNRYILSYVPKDSSRDGKYHSIQVQLLSPKGMGKLKAHWRSGYYAPTQ